MLQYVLAQPYHGFVLASVTIVYFLNQVDRYLYSAEAPPFISKQGATAECVARSYRARPSHTMAPFSLRRV